MCNDWLIKQSSRILFTTIHSILWGNSRSHNSPTIDWCFRIWIALLKWKWFYVKYCISYICKSNLTGWFNVPLETLLVPMPCDDNLFDTVLFRLAETRFEFVDCRLFAIGLYEYELCDLKPANKKKTHKEISEFNLDANIMRNTLLNKIYWININK